MTTEPDPEEPPANRGEPGGPSTNLLGEILSLPPRLASRTIAQVQASQRLVSALGCATRGASGDPTGGATPEDPRHATVEAPHGDTAEEHEMMQEPFDVLHVIAEPGDGGSGDDEPGDGATGPGPGEEATPSEPAAEAPPVDDLAIPGYDSLAASQVVPRLATLGHADLTAIEAYESSNRHRRTILNRVRQLLAADDGAG